MRSLFTKTGIMLLNTVKNALGMKRPVRFVGVLCASIAHGITRQKCIKSAEKLRPPCGMKNHASIVDVPLKYIKIGIIHLIIAKNVLGMKSLVISVDGQFASIVHGIIHRMCIKNAEMLRRLNGMRSPANTVEVH